MGMDVYGIAPANEAGEYFRANIWGWRPIHALCETVLERQLPDWAYNDGDGFKTQAECDDLATKLEAYLAAFPEEKISVESSMRVDETGKFLPEGSTEGKSPYEVRHERIKEFCKFLRACGGFSID